MPDSKDILKIGEGLIVIPKKSTDEIFIMALCLITSIPILLGIAPPPGSINSTMPRYMVMGWSATLVIGCTSNLLSFLFKERLTGMIVEQFGSVCLGVAAAIYSIAIFAKTYEQGGAIPGVIVLGFAATRLLQARSHQKTLNKVHDLRAKIAEKGVTGD